MPSICSVYGCTNRSNRGKNILFHKIPAIRKNVGEALSNYVIIRRKKWISALHLEGESEEKISKTKVCSDHFCSGQPAEIWDHENPDSVPTLKMGKKPTCCVPGCTTQGEGMAFFPSNRELRRKWIRNIFGANVSFLRNHFVCFDHFSVESFENENKRVLLPTAFPTIFVNFKKVPTNTTINAISTKTINVNNQAVLLDHSYSLNANELVNISNSAIGKSIRNGFKSEEVWSKSNSEFNSECKSKKKSLKRFYENNSSIRSVKEELESLIEENQNLVKENTELKGLLLKKTAVREMLKKKILHLIALDLGRFINPDQIMYMLKKKSRKIIWLPETLKKSLALWKKCKDSGYQTLRKLHYPLPPLRLLKLLTENSSFLLTKKSCILPTKSKSKRKRKIKEIMDL